MKTPVILGILLITVIVLSIHINKLEKEEAPVEPEMCEVGVTNPDGSVSLNQNSAGTYEYVAFITTSGIKILGECN